MKLRRIGKTSATEVSLPNGTIVLFSYQTPVVAYIPGRGYFRTSRFYSKTTSRHINNWLPCKKAPFIKEVEQNELDAIVDGRGNNGNKEPGEPADGLRGGQHGL